jgi:hypothetical protein
MKHYEIGLRLKTLHHRARFSIDKTSFPTKTYVLVWGPFLYMGDSIPSFLNQFVLGFFSSENLVG